MWFNPSNKKFELAKMSFFKLSRKKCASPPVKITVKLLYFFSNALIKPSISYKTPFTTPECIEVIVLFPISKLRLFASSKGSFSVNVCKDL